MQRLTGKIAIITGGGRGIGEAITRRFSQEGAVCAIAEIDGAMATQTAANIAAATGNRVIAVQTDVSNQQLVVAMHEYVNKECGVVDVLVNNAGITVFREPLEMTLEDWQKCIAVDLEGALHCSRAVLPSMLAKHNGAIINIISNHALSICKKTFPYPVAKHALLGMTRALALEYADRGVAVNAISPGYTDTQIAEDEFQRHDNPTLARRKIEIKQPVGRLCRPDEIAAVAAMLASEEARFIIGENIVIDGGVTIRMYE